MSEGNVAADQLRLFIERIERLEEEKRGMAEDVKDVFAEARANGYDVKIMRQILKLRRMDSHARREADALLETYRDALGLNNAYAHSPVTTRSAKLTPLEKVVAETVQYIERMEETGLISSSDDLGPEDVIAAQEVA